MSRTIRLAFVCMAMFGFSGVSLSSLSAQEATDAAAAEHSDSETHDSDHADDDGHSHDEAGAHDEGDSHGSENTPPLLSFDFGSAICNLAIFLGVLVILSKFVWPVILGGLQAREDKIFGELQEAEQANSQAKNLLSEYQGKLDGAATQVQAMLAEARSDAEASGQRIVQDAKEEAERQRERAVAEIETAKKVALSDLAGQTSDLAIGVAQQVLGRELKAEDHAELIRQSLDRLPSNN
ncbi:MAG: F0F1 ATP synthase subunit B [Rubripirellula sp.]